MSPIGNSSMIFLKLSFRREVGFYVLQVYIPLTIIVNTSFISLWLLRGEEGREVTARSYLLGETKGKVLKHLTSPSFNAMQIAILSTYLRIIQTSLFSSWLC